VSWELTNITARLVLPPGLLIFIALIGLTLARSRMRFGAGLTVFSLVSLYALSMPIVGRSLLQSLEAPHSDPARDVSPGAIVILGGGTYPRAPEYEEDTVSGETLERLRYGVQLQRRTGKPILVTGGNPAGHETSEARSMTSALRDFGVNARWIEEASHNTFENARLSSEILGKAGVHSVYLVTHAWHMPRAQMAFERAGLHVVPAPTAYTTSSGVRVLDLMPSGRALERSYTFFHEVAGRIWYRLRFDFGRENTKRT